MKISVTCRNCEKQYLVPSTLRGKKFACKQCGEPVPVGGRRRARARPVVEEYEDDEDEYEDEDDDHGNDYEDDYGAAPKPRRSRSASRRRSRSGSPAWLKPMLIGLGLTLGVGGVIALGIVFIPRLFEPADLSLARRQVAIVNDLADVFEGIETAADAEAAVADIKSVIKRTEDLMEEAIELMKDRAKQDDESFEDWTAHMEELEDDRSERHKETMKELAEDMRKAVDRLRDAGNRVMLDPDCAEVLRKEISASDFARLGPGMSGMRGIRGPGSLPGMRPRNTGLFRNMSERQVVTLTILGFDRSRRGDITNRLREIAGTGFALTSSPGPGGEVAKLGPIDDFQGFLACIDFGNVVGRDSGALTARVTFNPGWQYAPGQGRTLK